MKIIAYTTKGLEQIIAQEIETTLKSVRILNIASKRITFTTSSSLKKLTKLKTADDLALLIGTLNQVSRKSPDKKNLAKEIATFNLKQIQQVIHRFRPIDTKKFSITISAVGLKTFTSSELKQCLANTISKKYKWQYQKLDHSNFDIRIFLDLTDTDEAIVSVRITRQPIHKRKYKTLSKAGSLKPTIAAATVFTSTNNNKDLKIVDNCCGSGTILCEAYLAQNKVYGGDIDKESVEITKKNLKSLSFKGLENIKQLDCTDNNWPDNFFDCAVSNLPYGKQVKVDYMTNLCKESLREYMRIVKSKGTLCLLGTKPEIIRKYARKFDSKSKFEEIKLGFLGQNPVMSIIRLL